MASVATPPLLIRSKLRPPRRNSHHLSRPRLIHQLTRGAKGPLTLLSSLAGSGKSTLLSEWLSTVETPSAWLSLNERDNDLEVFLAYVLAAVERALPGATLETKILLEAHIPPPLETLAKSLSNDLDRLDDDLLLVFDDYHVIDNPRIHELLLLVLEHPPERLNVTLATRADPPWPLPALRARGMLTELRFPDLRFTAEESAALLQNSLDHGLQADAISALHDESEGWAAALHLMALVLHDREPVHPYRGAMPPATQDIGDYLLAEILSKQTDRDQARLLAMSILDRFSASLCEAVCREPEDHVPGEDAPASWGAPFLNRLEHANLFVVPLDGQHEFYRFHHLFQQFLAARLAERCSSAEIAELHRRASAWFADHNLIEEAIDHALKANDPTTAARLVADHRIALYNHEQFSRLARWLRWLPAEAKEAMPELLLAEARIATMNWRYTEAAVFLARADSLLERYDPDRADRDTLMGELVTLRAILEFWEGDAERFIASARYALAVLPPESSHLRGLGHTGLAAGLYLQGDIQGAWSYLNDQLAQHSPQLPVYAWLLQTLGFLQWLDGDLTRLHESATRLLHVSEDLALPDHEATAHLFLGMVHYARNELAAAESHLQHAVAARYTMRLLWWCQSAGILALTQEALGEREQARRTVADAHSFLLQQHAVRILPNVGAFIAEVDRLQDRLAAATAWASSVDPLPLTWSLAAADPRLVQVKVFLSQDGLAGHDRAAQLLAQLRSYCAEVPNQRLLLEVEALEALFHARRGCFDCALEILARAVRSAEKDGWVRLFVDLGPDMERLLAQLAQRGVSPHFVGSLLAAFPDGHAVPSPPFKTSSQALVEPLSERELEVLDLLAQRYSNKEIAAQLFIASSTVKRHTLNIYRKLEVSDRREAVARAADLSLLPPRIETGLRVASA